MLYYYVEKDCYFEYTCLKLYDLDFFHFYSGPGLTWLAALKITN